MSSVRSRAEHRRLELVDVLLHRAGHLDEGVDDEVRDGVEDRGRAQAQQVALLLQPGPQLGQPAVPAVPHGDHVVRAEEDHDLAGVDHLAGRGQLLVLHVGRRLEHHEQRVVVALELGALVGVDRVLDGERVQPVAAGDGAQLRLRRLVEAQPDEAAGLGGHPQRVLRRDRRLPPAVDVDRAVDDGVLAAPARVGAWRLPPGRTGAQAGRLTRRGDGGRGSGATSGRAVGLSLALIGASSSARPRVPGRVQRRHAPSRRPCHAAGRDDRCPTRGTPWPQAPAG